MVIREGQVLMQSQGSAVLTLQSKHLLNVNEVVHLKGTRDYTSNSKLRNEV